MNSKQTTDKAQEIDQNYEYFQSIVDGLMDTHQGRYVLLRKKEIVGIFDTIRDAQMTGETFYKDDVFSVQKVENQPVDLGIFSHAIHLG